MSTVVGRPKDPQIAALWTIITTHRLTVAVAGLILYDHLATFKDEISIIWSNKLTPASLLLLTIRYTLLVEAVFILLPPPDIERFFSCSSRTAMVLAPVVIAKIQTAGFSALRAFAMWKRSYPVFFVVFVLGLSPVPWNTYALATRHAPMGFVGDHIYICNQSRLYSGVMNHADWHVDALGSRLPLILSELIVLALTWARTYRAYMVGQRTGVYYSLRTCLLRDGSLYFVALLVINIVEIVMVVNPSNASAFVPILDIIPPILTARFIINLRTIPPLPNAGMARTRPTMRFTSAQFAEPISIDDEIWSSNEGSNPTEQYELYEYVGGREFTHPPPS